eukprot:1565180-Amphidinium_carterae.1
MATAKSVTEASAPSLLMTNTYTEWVVVLFHSTTGRSAMVNAPCNWVTHSGVSNSVTLSPHEALMRV